MQWEHIRPALAGMATSRQQRVSVASRAHGNERRRLHLGFTSPLMIALGWAPTEEVVTHFARAEGVLRVTKGSEWKLTSRAKNGSIGAQLSLRWDLADLTNHTAAIAPHQIVDPGDGSPLALLVTLPDWAVPLRAGMQGAAKAMEEARARAPHMVGRSVVRRPG